MSEHRVAGWRRLLLPERRWDALAIVAIVLGAVLRVVWILVIHHPQGSVYSDMKGYVTRAERLASGGPLGPNDAFYPPGTQLLLALPIKIVGIEAGLWAAAVLWCAMSTAVVWLAWRLARDLLTPAAAGLTAVMCAGSPLFISYGGFFTSETPALAFLLTALWLGLLATRRTGPTAVWLALVSGLSGGVAVAVRPQLLLNVVMLAAIVLFVFRKRIAPFASLGAGLFAVLFLVVAHNTVATGQPTGLATNGGLNFWFGHCEVGRVTTHDPNGQQTAWFEQSVPDQLGRGGQYAFNGINVWDEDFFFELGWDCIEQDKEAHVFRLARNVLDMTATTVPFPQSDERGWARDLVQAANVGYAVLLPWVVIESLFTVFRRRRALRPLGEAFMLANLACAAVVAMLILGDPRVRSVYDVFGLALLSALLADRFNLDEPERPRHPEHP
ncbi:MULTISPECIES: ArnT family glycosyltransferase [unclassified Mycobacterium]|uniref:ArnT family glycosyltransferase n=1 Tax=unclassified Mycobacterium TaxID=2642494 RepID=UPI0029C97A4B|nr:MULTISPECIES: glycosyltransferase family 39 protein [unclassified Mycobacterium]